MLGPAETIAGESDVFDVADKKHRIFVKGGARAANAVVPEPSVERLSAEATRILRRRGAPPAVMVDDKLDVVQVYGRTGLYLAPAAGEPSWNLLAMLRDGLRDDIRPALDSARKSHEPARCRPFEVKRDGRRFVVDLEIVPLCRRERSPLLVMFERRRSRVGRLTAVEDAAPRMKALPAHSLQGGGH